MLAYRRWNSRRSLVLAQTGILRFYPGYMDGPTVGGMFDLDGWTYVGQGLKLGVSQILRYDPLLSASTLSIGSIPPANGNVQTAPAAGLFEKPSVNNISNFEIVRPWGRRDSTSLNYTYRTDLFTEQDAGDARSHSVGAVHRRVMNGSFAVHGSYQFMGRGNTAADGGTLYSSEHRIEGGPAIRRAFSRESSIGLSVFAGAGYLESRGSADRSPYQTWLPMGRASLTVIFSPSWSMESGYQRYFSLLRGATENIYSTDTAYLGTSRRLTDRASLSTGVSYSNSVTPQASGIDETFRVYGASVQSDIAIGENWGLTAGYYFYNHRYSSPASVAPGFPPEYNRHAVRVGLSLRLTVAGTGHRWGQPPPRL